MKLLFGSFGNTRIREVGPPPLTVLSQMTRELIPQLADAVLTNSDIKSFTEKANWPCRLKCSGRFVQPVCAYESASRMSVHNSQRLK